jgi:hypothetical protein
MIKEFRIQQKALRQLEEAGWLVNIIEDKKLFELFNLIAIQRGTIKLVQVSTNTNHPHKAFSEFNEKYGNNNLSIEQWIYKDGKGFIKKEYGRM